MRKPKELSEPPTVGRTLHQSDIQQLVNRNEFHSISLRLPCGCNLRCPYCYSEAGRSSWAKGGQSLTYNELLSILDDAFDLGVTTVSIVGDGEPLLYKEGDNDIFSLLTHLRDSGKRSVLFTNATLVGEKEARRLYDLGVTVIAKQNSLDDIIQNELIGKKQAQKIQEGLGHLIKVGFTRESRLAVHTIICRQNYQEIPKLWRLWRQQDIIPYVQVAVPPVDRGERERFLKDFWVPPNAVKKLFSCLLRIDEEEFGYTWDVDNTYPIAAMGCTVVLTGFAITAEGNVQLCAYTEAPKGNVKEQPLKAILKQSDVLKIRRHNYEQAGRWPFYGCRALTFNLTGDRFSADPFWWGNCKNRRSYRLKRSCIKAKAANANFFP